MRTLQATRRATLTLLCTVLVLCLAPLSPATAAPWQETPTPAPHEPEYTPYAEAAQDPPPPAPVLEEPGDSELTLESLDAYRQTIEADTSISEAARTAALAEIQSAHDALTRAAAGRTATGQYRDDIQAAPQLVMEIQDELDQPLEEQAPVHLDDSTLMEIQDEADNAAAALAQAQGARERLQATATRRSERMVAIDGELLAAQARLDSLLSELEEPTTTEPDPMIRDAQRHRLLAHIQEARALLARLDAEQDRDQAVEQLTSLRLDLARRNVKSAEQNQEAWNQILGDERSQAAELAVEKAAKARTVLALTHTILRPIIDSIEALSQELSGPDSVVALMNAASEERTIFSKENLRVRASYRDTLQRFDVAGSTQALGFFLRLEYDKLVYGPGRLRIDSRRRQQQISTAYYRVYVLKERRENLGDIGGRVQKLLEKAPPFASSEDKQAFIDAATSLCTNERELVDSLARNNEAYGHILSATEASVADLIGLTQTYEAFIRQHILWQRSVDHPFSFEPEVVIDGFEWIARGDEGDLKSLESALSERGLLLLAYGLVIGALFAFRYRARKRIAAMAPLVRSFRTDSLRHTRAVLLLSLLAALPWPAVIYGASWLLEQTVGESQSPWRLSWAGTLSGLTGYMFAICLVLEVLRRDGLAKAHLRWKDEACSRTAVLIVEFMVPLWFLGLAQLPLQVWGDSPYRDTTGRLLFIATMLTLGAFCFSAFSPRGKVLRPFYDQHPDSVLTRARSGLHVLSIAGPVIAFVLAVIGYFFTARMIARGMLGTLMLAFGVILAVSLANRWQFFHRRRLAHKLALEKRAEREAGSPEIDAIEFDDEVDIPDLEAKAGRLIANVASALMLVGLASIWSDALPALRILERVQILPTFEVVSESVTASHWIVPGLATMAPVEDTPREAAQDSANEEPDRTASAPPFPLSMPGSSLSASDAQQAPDAEAAYRLTAADILSALIVLIVTILVVRNGPALLELGLLTRLRIDAGARYAITTLLKYALITIGSMLTFNALGIGWQSVQWLAAALTFGLAFGLQEIFANFISGLILLVERPIRIGDTVTIGDLTGTVARIRPRATTILDYDNRERLIPNKKLVTDDVINWTLSSSVTRLVVPVGVAYGTDTAKVFEGLMKAAKLSAEVMDDPAPSVLFKGFGESSLDFTVRFYIEDRDHWVAALNDVNTRIDNIFREAGIEIAFPQRDLHLRSSDIALGPG